MYPRVIVNLEHIRNNVRVVRSLCEEHGIRIVGVTKVFSGDPRIAQCYIDGGLAMTGDSRVANLRLQAEEGLDAERWLIRPPMLSEVHDLVRCADASLNSEIDVIRAINDEICAINAKRDAEAGQDVRVFHKAPHKIVLMADLGDIREGYTDYDEMIEVAKEVEAMKGVYLYGIGVNLTCFSFIQPDEDKMNQLAGLRKRVSEAIGRPIDIVSGGNLRTRQTGLRS